MMVVQGSFKLVRCIKGLRKQQTRSITRGGAFNAFEIGLNAQDPVTQAVTRAVVLPSGALANFTLIKSPKS